MSQPDGKKRAKSLASFKSNDSQERLAIVQGDGLSDPETSQMGVPDDTVVRERHETNNTRESETGVHFDQHRPAWLLWSKFWRAVMLLGSHELENEGTVARDHLANERTYLAWLRTSLSFSSIGIAVAQLLRLNVLSSSDSETQGSKLEKLAKPLGASLVGIGLIVVLLGARRYYVAQLLLTEGKFPVSKGSVLITATLTVAIVAVCLSAVLAAIQ